MGRASVRDFLSSFIVFAVFYAFTQHLRVWPNIDRLPSFFLNYSGGVVFSGMCTQCLAKSAAHFVNLIVFGSVLAIALSAPICRIIQQKNGTRSRAYIDSLPSFFRGFDEGAVFSGMCTQSLAKTTTHFANLILFGGALAITLSAASHAPSADKAPSLLLPAQMYGNSSVPMGCTLSGAGPSPVMGKTHDPRVHLRDPHGKPRD